MTELDRGLYARAVARLLDDLCEVQRKTGKQLVCHAQLDKLKARVAHIDGLAEQIEARKDCNQAPQADHAGIAPHWENYSLAFP